jgi:hypothetical protein
VGPLIIVPVAGVVDTDGSRGNDPDITAGVFRVDRVCRCLRGAVHPGKVRHPQPTGEGSDWRCTAAGPTRSGRVASSGLVVTLSPLVSGCLIGTKHCDEK